ncbi:Protein of unknown function (DUF295 [Striga hermonthica]|uniref:KIB1-4 beta-propeller domain-containing protein n=1 Tax=Striga hermonthica TaxID=68872 RepID=A0A9N7N170_STRHE|nr:Protein of unknown function (DUF295 [Striga hermonthica]
MVLCRRGGPAALKMATKSYNGLIFNSFTRHGPKLSTMINANVPKTKRSSSTSPWLMLPPVFQGNNKNKKLDMFYQFYSLGLDRVLSVPKRSTPSSCDDDSCVPGDNLDIVGSSRGWLALFKEENYCDLFLSNPLTGRHIKLPSLDPLSYKGLNVHNVIISSDDPFEQDCRVLITCSPNDRLAFCCPGHTNSEWTRIGHPSTSFQFDSLTYSSRQKLFFCAKGPSSRTDHIETWDLHDPLSPKMVPLPVTVDKHNYPVASHSELESELKHLCAYDAVFLVLSEHTDELFQVRQYVWHLMAHFSIMSITRGVLMKACRTRLLGLMFTSMNQRREKWIIWIVTWVGWHYS